MGGEVQMRLEGAYSERMGKCMKRKHCDNYQDNLTKVNW